MGRRLLRRQPPQTAPVREEANMSVRPILALVLAALSAACGSAGGGGAAPPPGGGGPATITIRAFTFNPANLTVAPGATVTVVNEDGTAHSVTSQAAPGQFTPGSVAGISFDTGPFTGTRSFSIPANAPDGTVVPYFCEVHRRDMLNAGQITVSAAAIGSGNSSADAGTTGTSPAPAPPY
jgi:plastocyanin